MHCCDLFREHCSIFAEKGLRSSQFKGTFQFYRNLIGVILLTILSQLFKKKSLESMQNIISLLLPNISFKNDRLTI